jgi:hypothetical protein
MRTYSNSLNTENTRYEKHYEGSLTPRWEAYANV